MIGCKTMIGFGAPTKAGTAGVHGARLAPRKIGGREKALGWTAPAFEIPENIAAAWAEAGHRKLPSHMMLGSERYGCSGKDVAERFRPISPAIWLPAVVDANEAFKKAATEAARRRQAAPRRRRLSIFGESAGQSHRRLGRSHPFEPDPAAGTVNVIAQDYGGTYVITASANSAWRPR